MPNSLSWPKTTNSSVSIAAATGYQIDLTGSRTVTFSNPGGLAVVACACLIGTGGMMTPDYFNQRQNKGYDFANVTCIGRAPSTRTLREPRENLAHVRSVFRPSIAELASIFGVTRQTLYNWMSGDRPALESAERLGRPRKKPGTFLRQKALSASAYLFQEKAPQRKVLGRRGS